VPPLIPVLDIPARQAQALASARAEPERLALLLDQGRRTYTQLGLRLADARSRGWARRLASPYAEEVADAARAVGRPGVFLLNYSYEWGCTTGGAPDPGEGGATLLRTLDWPFDGVGRAVIVTSGQAEAGGWLNVTWPGFAGALTGLAPGRFAAAINLAPLPLPRWGKPVGWLAARWLVGRSRALPPSHLLRLAFETCRDFAAAVALIRTTPICVPAIFTLTGPGAGEAVVIERSRDAAFAVPQPVAANHWACVAAPPGHPRDRTSPARREAMAVRLAAGADWSLGWLAPPILRRDTRLVAMANPRSGRLLVQGWEKTGAVTEVLHLR
jgi:hypothetical protein